MSIMLVGRRGQLVQRSTRAEMHSLVVADTLCLHDLQWTSSERRPQEQGMRDYSEADLDRIYKSQTHLFALLQDGSQKVNSIFERARALGATEGSIADLQQPKSSGDMLYLLMCKSLLLSAGPGLQVFQHTLLLVIHVVNQTLICFHEQRSQSCFS